MRSRLLPAIVVMLAATPAWADTRPFRCLDAAGANPFHLDYGAAGYYTVLSETGSVPFMAGGGSLSRLDGGTGYEILGGPLEDQLEAKFLHVDDNAPVISGPKSGTLTCEKSKS